MRTKKAATNKSFTEHLDLQVIALDSKGELPTDTEKFAQSFNLFHTFDQAARACDKRGELNPGTEFAVIKRGERSIKYMAGNLTDKEKAACLD